MTDSENAPPQIETERVRIVSVRLSEDEYARVQRGAKRIGLRVSQFLRTAALEKTHSDKGDQGEPS